MKHLSEYRKDARFSTVIHELSQSCVASKEHSTLASNALTMYGDEGSLISGCVREHFPQEIKDALRNLAHAVTAHSDAAFAARPSRVRHATMIHIAKLVAGEVGHGFYGFQPY